MNPVSHLAVNDDGRNADVRSSGRRVIDSVTEPKDVGCGLASRASKEPEVAQLPMVATSRMMNAAVNAWHSWKSRDNGGSIQQLGVLMWEHMADAAPKPGDWEFKSRVACGSEKPRVPCAVCALLPSEHGSYPTCATHPYTADGNCQHVLGAACVGAECKSGCVRVRVAWPFLAKGALQSHVRNDEPARDASFEGAKPFASNGPSEKNSV